MARRWIIRLALLGLVAAAVWQWRARAALAPATESAPTRSPEPSTSPAPKPAPVAEPHPARAPTPEPEATWREPVDGAHCPDGFPVKVNVRSGIAHVPGGRFYDRTVPDRCYATAADAQADGYRLAKA